MNNFRVTGFLFILYYLACLAVFAVTPFLGLAFPLHDAMVLGSLVIAVVAGLYAIKMYGTTSIRSVTLIGLGFTMLSWFIGEAIYDYLQYFTHIKPSPSPADIFYLLPYPILIYVLKRELNISKTTLGRLSKGERFLVVLISLFLIAIVAYFGVFLAYSPAQNWLLNVVNIAYGAGDLILIIVTTAIVVLVIEYQGGALSRIWTYIYFAIFLMLAADVFYAVFINEYLQNELFYRNLTDSLYVLSYLCFAYALFSFGFSIAHATHHLKKLKSMPQA
jgi:hypothetical protein